MLGAISVAAVFASVVDVAPRLAPEVSTAATACGTAATVDAPYLLKISAALPPRSTFAAYLFSISCPSFRMRRCNLFARPESDKSPSCCPETNSNGESATSSASASVSAIPCAAWLMPFIVAPAMPFPTEYFCCFPGVLFPENVALPSLLWFFGITTFCRVTGVVFTGLVRYTVGGEETGALALPVCINFPRRPCATVVAIGCSVFNFFSSLLVFSATSFPISVLRVSQPVFVQHLLHARLLLVAQFIPERINTSDSIIGTPLCKHRAQTAHSRIEIARIIAFA